MTGSHLPQLPDPLAHRLYSQALDLVNQLQIASTSHLARILAPEFSSHRSAVRQLQRCLKQLHAHGYLHQAGRRIGGPQRGSSQNIWTLTSTGHHAITGQRKRLRPELRSNQFMAHSLAVTEIRVILNETTRDQGHRLVITPEPECWRTYMDRHGLVAHLRPDLHSEIGMNEESYTAWIEADRDTENPARVVAKCRRYHAYYLTGREEPISNGIFPEVLWVVPTEHRAMTLRRHIAEATDLIPQMFAVITLDELADAIRRRTAPTQAPKPQ